MQEAGEDFEDAAAAASDSDGENQSDKPSAPKKVKLKPVSKNPRNRMASDDPNAQRFDICQCMLCAIVIAHFFNLSIFKAGRLCASNTCAHATCDVFVD